MAAEKAKFLGKLYVDRYIDHQIDQPVILRAIKIIADQAPKKGKAAVQFIAIPGSVGRTGKSQPATLLSINVKSGISLSKTPIANILSVGRVKSIAYILSRGADNGTIQRYWVRAFACRSRNAARAVIRHVLSLSNEVKPSCAYALGSKPTTGTQLSLESTSSATSTDTDTTSPTSRVPFAPLNLDRANSLANVLPATVPTAKKTHFPPEAQGHGHAQATRKQDMMQFSLGNLDDYVRVVDV
eukprot:m.74842 g.74842  ORF g.74842 m.74842 type:complete len:242 (-) comp8942_c0_seq4:198-923(-)